MQTLPLNATPCHILFCSSKRRCISWPRKRVAPYGATWGHRWDIWQGYSRDNKKSSLAKKKVRKVSKTRYGQYSWLIIKPQEKWWLTMTSAFVSFWYSPSLVSYDRNFTILWTNCTAYEMGNMQDRACCLDVESAMIIHRLASFVGSLSSKQMPISTKIRLLPYPSAGR